MSRRTLLTPSLTLRALVLGAAALLTAKAHAADPWQRPFASDAVAIARAAAQAKAPAGTDAIVLFEEGRYQFDAAGRSTYSYRQVARVLRQSAVDEWANWSTTWSPWYEERPTLRARVIARDGHVRELDPATIEERSEGGGSRDVYSDQKSLRAPLPGVAEGVVVEVELVSKDRQPFFEAGTVNRFYFGKGVPTERARLIVEAPKSLTISFQTLGLPGLKPERTEANGRVTWTFERTSLAPLPALEADAPPSWPKVMFATGPSWAAVAKRYARLVDEAIAGGDVAALAAEARAGAKGREAIAARLLERLHKEVRYTGIEFGAASIVPATPQKTLARQFGDCKDQATLLVALLRASGVAANVALLRTGPGLDSDAGLPGLDFDHAIVYLPGQPALWIDPTDRYARVGELPLGDQGRHALIAAPTTAGLIDTPAPRAAQNLMFEERTFELAEDGKARVLELTRMTGEFERQYRDYRSEVDPDKEREQLEQYVKDTYQASKLNKIESDDPNDLGRPYELKLESSGAGRGVTYADHAEVGIFPQAVLRWLPDVLKEKPKSSEPRRHDVLVHRPFRCEHRYHIVPPPGYAANQLPEPRRIDVGPFHIDVRFDKTAQGRVDGLVAFETYKSTLTAKEVEAVREKFAELDGQDGILLRLENVAESHLEAGRTKEGIAELRRLQALHPKEALHAIRLAQALLREGLGEPARDAARRAVDLEPRNAVAWETLGNVLTSDLLGRPHERGWDPAGAETALRRAKALDPKAFGPRFALAILLEHDAETNRYSSRARLPEAAAEYRALRKELDSKDADENLLILLMRMGRTDEVKTLAKQMAATEHRDSVVVTAVAMRDGVDAAVKEAQALGTDSKARSNLLAVAGATLLQLRYYPEAAALSQRASAGGRNLISAAQAQQMAKLRKREGVTLPADEPIAFVRRVFIAASTGRDPSAVAPFVLGEGWPVEGDAVEIWFALQKLLASISLPADVFADLAASASLPMTQEGDARWGWRVRMATPLGQATELYVVRTGAGLRLIVETAPARLGDRALKALDRGDVEAARHWLLWLKEAVAARSGNAFASDALAELAAVDDRADRATLESAAAQLVAGSRVAAGALPYLDRCAAAGVAEPRRTRCANARVLALAVAGRGTEALAAAEARISEQPDQMMNHVVRAGVLFDLGRKAEGARAFAELRRRWPNEASVDWVAASMAVDEGRCAEARSSYRRLIDSDHIDAVGRNQYAWCALAAGPVTDDDLEQARRAVEETGRTKPSVLNTLATLLADRGQVDAARDALRETVLPGRPVEGADWLVVGRMEEQLGLVDAARRAYGRISKPKIANEQTVWAIAQRRLAAIGERATKK